MGSGHLQATDVSRRLGTVFTILGAEAPRKMRLLRLHHPVGYPKVQTDPQDSKQRRPQQGIASHYEEVRYDLRISTESVGTGLP